MIKCLAMKIFGILVHLNYHKETSQTRYLIDNRDFLILLEDKKPKIKYLVCFMTDEGPLSHRCLLLLVASRDRSL